MARLSSYSKDIAITGDDKLIGSNYGGLDNQGRPIFTTANYKISDLLTYFQENISTSGVNITGLREFQINLADSLGTYSSDGTLSSLSSAFVNLFASAEAGNKFATSTFQTNMETSVLTFDGSGNATVAEAFANQIMTTTSSDRFATSTYAQNIGSSFGTVASDGTVTLSEAFANSVITTTSSDRFATSTYAQNLGSSIGTVDSSGNITVSEAFANSVMNTETATDYASSSSVTSLASTVSTKPDIFRQTSAPSTSNAVGSLWYDTDDNNKVYVLVAGDPNVWTLTDDSRIGSLVTSTAIINQTLSTHTSDISANATFATGLASSFGTYDATTGEITALSTSFANAVMTTENTTDYAAASDVTELNTQFVFTNGEITGTSGAISTEIASAQSNATNAAASKVEDLAANFFTGYDAADGSYTATSLSADFKTAVNAEVDANSSTADYVSNLSAAVGIDKTDGSTLQATAYINNATVYTTTATVNGAVASSKEVTITASNSNIEVGQYVTYSTQSSDSNNDIVWRVIGVSGTTITLDNEIVLENATTLTFTGKSTYNIDGVSGNIVDGFQVKGTGITVGTFVTDYTSPALTLNRAEVLSDDTALEFLGVYAAVKETASVLAGIDGNLKSTYGMQVDANGNIASMKLIADNTGSEISFLADTFKVYNGTDAGVAPFEIVDGVVKIKSANIGDVSFGDLTNIPDTFVITIVYADDASGTNQSLTKGSYNYYGIYQGQAALTTNDLPVSGVTFNQITGTSGTNGIDAKVVKLTPSKHVINYDTDGTESDSITFTTEVQNITNSVTYRFDIVNNAGSVTTGTASATSTFTLNDADEPAEGERTTVKVYVFENGTQVATDSVTIYAVKDGSSAVTGFLTNASHTCSADNDGGNPVLTGSGGDFKVFVGGTDVSSSCTFSVVSYTSGLTITIDSSSGAYTITGLTVDTATAVLKAVVPAATAGTADNVEITQIYSISKSIKGNTGTTGATGPTGARVYTTNLFYQTIVTDSSTPTFDDSSLDYDFDTASWSGIPSGWAVNPPSSSPGSGTNKLYYVSVSVIEGDPDNTLSVGSPTTYFNFNGLVTFTGAGNTTLTDGSNNFNYTAIDGAYITTGAITSHDFTYTDANTSGSFQETETVTNGMIIDLDGNYIKSPSLWLKSDGSAIFSGEVNILDASDDTVVKVHNGSTFTDLTVDADAVSYSNITNLEVSTWASSDTTISGSGTTIGTLAGDDPYEYIYGNSNSATFSTGAYNHTITTAAITSSIISTNSSFDNGGYIYLYLGVQFGNSNFSTIYLDKVLGSSSITGPNQTLTFPATSNDISLAFSTSTTAYIRFYWRRVWKTANGAGTCTARALDITSDLSFDGTKGLAELSPSGMQVTVADNIYFKVNRSGYDLTSPYVDIAGNTKIDGNLEVTGNINLTGDIQNSDVSVDKLQLRLSQISSNTFIGDSSSSSTFTVRDNLIIDGNLTVNGTTVTVNTTNLSVADNLIHVGDNNNLNTVDLGIVGHYSNDGTTANHVGLFWDASATNWKFFDEYTKDELGSAAVDTAHASFSLGDVEASSFTGSSFIKSGGTSSQFLKADGTVDSSTYLTSYTETDTLATVTGRGATTTNAITVGGLTVDTDTLHVDATNNRVGIGTTAPSTKLHIALSGGSGQLTLERTGSGAGKAVLAGAAEGLIVYDDAYGTKMYVGTAGTYNGRVGIGTITPNANLHVYSSGNGEIEVERASGALINLQAQSTIGVIGTDSNHPLYLKTNAGTRLAIATSGNVGIGTTSPNEKFHAAGNIHAYDPNGINAALFASTAAGSTTIAVRSNGITHFNGGNVGIGTTLPSGTLDVNVTGNNRVLRLSRDTGTNGRLDIDFESALTNLESLGSFVFKLGASPNEAMRLTGTGLGIGTTTPSSLLTLGTYVGSGHINESALPTTPDKHLINLTPPSTTNYFGGGISWSEGTKTAASINAVDAGGGGALALAFSTGNNTTLTESMRITTAGSVGIGTITPDVKLEVIDASPTDGVIADFVNSTNAGGTTAAIKLSNADSEACDVILGANRVGANFGSDFFISLSDSVDGTNQERFRITEAGNVTVSTGNLNVSAGDLQIGGVTTITNARAITGSSLSVTNGISSSTATISQVNAGFISTTNDITLSNTKGILASGTVNVGYASITSTSDGLTFDARAGASNKSAFVVSNSAGTKQLVVDKDGGGTSYFEGSLGIGNPSPSRPLHISADTPAIRLEDTTGSDYSELVSVNGDLYIRADEGNTEASSTIRFQIDQSERMRITSAGRIGIGQSNPADALDVNGAIRLGDQYELKFGGTTSTIFGSSSLNQLRFYTNNTERMRIDSSGNVSMTGSGFNPLTISSSSTSYETGYWYSDTKGIGIATGAGSGWTNLLYLDKDSNIAKFFTNGSERMRIDNAGNVGIGNSVASSFNQRVSAPHLVVGSGSNSAGVTIYSGTTAQGSINFADGTTTTEQYMGGIVYVHGSDNYMVFNTNGASERLRIDSSGNIRVKGTNTKLAWERASDGAADVVYLTKKEDISSNGNARLQGYDGIVFSTAGTEIERMRIDSSGNVGIGTTSPAQHQSGTETVLHIANSNVASINLDSTAVSGRTYVMSSTASGNWSIYDDDANATRISLNSLGNVGIGTTSPSTGRLVVHGGDIEVRDSTGNTGGRIKAFDNYHAIYFREGAQNRTNYYQYGGTLSAGLGHRFLTGGTSQSLRMQIADDGIYMANNVGIGTTSPNEKLEVAGQVYVNGSQVWSETTQGPTRGTIHIDPASATDHAGGAITWGASDSSNGTTAQAGIYVRSDGSYGTKMYFSTTNSYAAGSKTAMSIDNYGNARSSGAMIANGGFTSAKSTYNMELGSASFSWAGSTVYPTIYGSHADRWVMICHPHIPYLQNGVNGYTGNTSGSAITYASNASTSTYWRAGVRASNDADTFEISRATSRHFWVTSTGQTHTNDWWRTNGGGGVYFQSYGRGLWSTDAQGSSYGNVSTYGSGKNSYQGWTIGGYNVSFMEESNGGGLYDASNGIWRFYYHKSNNGASIGASTTSSSYKLYVSGAIYATGDVVAYSDRRVKENIININSALDKVKALQGVYYNRINDKDKVREIGFIAQDVHDAVPELASYAEDVDEWGVKYSQVTGLHNEAIKELAQELDKKDEQIANLQAQIDELKQLILKK